MNEIEKLTKEKDSWFETAKSSLARESNWQRLIFEANGKRKAMATKHAVTCRQVNDLRQALHRANKLIESQATENDKLVTKLNSRIKELEDYHLD